MDKYRVFTLGSLFFSTKSLIYQAAKISFHLWPVFSLHHANVLATTFDIRITG
jgi:hypothetical protein